MHTESELTPVTRKEVEFALKGMPQNKGLYRNAGCIKGSKTDKTHKLNKYDVPRRHIQFHIQHSAKISGTAKCENHRTISLISHVTKLVLRVLINRLRVRSLMEILQVHYGFMPDCGTRNAIFV